MREAIPPACQRHRMFLFPSMMFLFLLYTFWIRERERERKKREKKRAQVCPRTSKRRQDSAGSLKSFGPLFILSYFYLFYCLPLHLTPLHLYSSVCLLRVEKNKFDEHFSMIEFYNKILWLNFTTELHDWILQWNFMTKLYNRISWLNFRTKFHD